MRRGQGRSDRLLFMSPPQAQSSLLATLSSSGPGLLAWVHIQQVQTLKERARLGSTALLLLFLTQHSERECMSTTTEN